MSDPATLKRDRAGRPLEVDVHRSDTHFQRLLEKLPAAAYTCNPDGLITYYNQKAVALWGRKPALNDARDRFCGSFKLFATDGTPLDHAQCWMALALRENRGYNEQEILVERPDGKRLIVVAHANPIHDEAGHLIGAVNVLVDVTAFKQAEAALREADNAKNRFLATLAHELRNPLAPIRNAVEILHRTAEPAPEVTWALGVIDRQMQQMTRLIDDLLDLARITSNKLDICTKPIAVAEILRTALEISRPHIDAAGLDLSVSEPAMPLYVEGDLTRLAQVISNLLNNAAKYTPHGGRVWLGATEEAGEVVVRVRDTGVGIPAELLPRIFDMFTQANELPAWSPNGLGIGLTLARQVVEMHGGRIVAQSEGRDRGSTFAVRLPALQTVPSASVEAAPAPAAPGTPLRILVADDSEDILVSLTLLLEMAGHEVQGALDGHQALVAAEAFRPDVILLDIGMPQLNGYDTARALRTQPWGQSAVLIAFTGWGQESDRARAREAGFDHHIVKPVDPDALIDLIASLQPRHRNGQNG